MLKFNGYLQIILVYQLNSYESIVARKNKAYTVSFYTWGLRPGGAQANNWLVCFVKQK